MNVKAPYNIENYLESIELLNRQNRFDRILELIMEQKTLNAPHPPLLLFFSAEEAFYKRNYKTALQSYLQAKTISYYEFFCFRASAYVSESMRNPLKAIQFAKKALRIRPHDCATLALLAKAYTTIEQPDKAQIIQKKILSLTDNPPESFPSQPEQAHFPPVGEEKLEEFSQIISPKGADEAMGLFREPKLSGCRNQKENNAEPYMLGEKRERQIEEYHSLYQRRVHSHTNFLFAGYEKKILKHPPPLQNLLPFCRKSYLIHWQGCGIAINPGQNFLDHLHHSSLFLQDLHAVIITEPAADSLEELNNLCILSSKLSALHLHTPLTFYIHPSFYPHFKRRWPTYQQIYTLTDSWNIHDTIQCNTYRTCDHIHGIHIQCKNSSGQTSLAYLHDKPTDLHPCDILIMNSLHASAAYIQAIHPKITILYNLMQSSYEELRQIKLLQEQLAGTSKLLPCPAHLKMQLASYLFETGDGEPPLDICNLCAIATSPFTIELVSKQLLLNY